MTFVEAVVTGPNVDSPPPRVAARLAEQAYSGIRQAIQDGRFEPGQRVTEVGLSEWLGMSRTPVREALRRLQADNIVVHASSGGLAIAKHDLQAMAELYDLRESLEGTAAALAARHALASELVVLRAMLAAARLLPSDPAVHAREDIRLHRQIYLAAHNRFLLKQVAEIQEAVVLSGKTTYSAESRFEQDWAEHEQIVELIIRRDEEGAERMMRQHVRRGLELQLQAMLRSATTGSYP